MTGDGTTSTVLLIGEFLKQAELYIADNLHPRVITEGFEAGKKKALAILDEMKITLTEEEKRDVLVKIAKTSLNTKLHPKMASQLTDICVDAMLSIDQAGIHKSIQMDLNCIKFEPNYRTLSRKPNGKT